MNVRLPKIITRRRAKWTGLVATLLLAATMIASLWLWPSYSWETVESSVFWRVRLVPGGIAVYRDDERGYRDPWPPSPLGLRLLRLSSGRIITITRPSPEPPPNPAWLPSRFTISFSGSIHQTVKIPFWIPLVLIALPTGILFYRDRKPKAGCCMKCRYDLTGLSGDTCPECGTKIATTDSPKAPTHTAGGENGVS